MARSAGKNSFGVFALLGQPRQRRIETGAASRFVAIRCRQANHPSTWKARRAQFFLSIATVAAFLIIFTTNAPGAEPKRVLLVQSFGSAATPFTARLTAFETELIAKMGDRVDLDEVSLDMARSADRDIQEAIVNYLQKRQAKWQPDLVVPIGSSATLFVANYRDQLFPKTPVLYVVDQRLLPPGALEKNAAYVGQEIDLSGLLEDMLQVAPATKNIAVIVGATPLEHNWQKAFQKAAEPLAGRINFTYYSDLSFDQMRERVSTLPPDSYIFFLVLVRDAAGVTLNSDGALRSLHAAAHAPINSIFEHQLGLGIVGGRLYQSEEVGKEAADVAVRILHGEPASSIPPRLFQRLPARYDWRELDRWKINEKLLPPGSTVLFREPTIWSRYRGWIIGGISICILEALLIASLVANLIKRHRAERERELAEEQARKSREEFHRLSRISLLGEMTASIAHEINQPLSAIANNASAGKRFVDRGDVDLATLREILVEIASDSHRARDIISHIRNTIKKGAAMRERINVNNIVTQVSHMVQSDMRARSCELELALAEDLPAVEGDPLEIQQVLINLVTNACDAMRNTNTVDRKLKISTERNDNETIRITVRDHGAGIAPEARDRLFEQFFTTKEEGLGMGLVIVRSIVEDHGGTIGAENVDSGGARFYFTLPTGKTS